MPSPSPHLFCESGRLWQNYHQNVSFKPDAYYDVWNFWDDNSYPSDRRWEPGLAALKKIVEAAQGSQIRRVRALGGGWSLSEAAETDGFLVNTKPLNIIEIGVRGEHCHASFLANTDPGHLVFAQCGASIGELSAALESNGLSLPTSGASNGQTICGAMSTGTHGAAIQLAEGGGVQDYIYGLHLIGSDGKDYWVQSKTAPVVTQSFCDILNTRLWEDDELFDAVRVSFGSFGIVHAVLLKAKPIYLLERHVCPLPFARVAPVLGDLSRIPELRLTDINGKIPDDLPYHFEVLLNPYALEHKGGVWREKSGRRATYVRYMFRRDIGDLRKYSPGGQLLGREPGNTTKSNDAFALIGSLANFAADIHALDCALEFALSNQLEPDNGADRIGTLLTHGGTFDASQIPGHSISCELGVGIDHVPAAIDAIVKAMREHSFACPPAFRFVQPSKASLAWTPFGPYTCAIEFPTADTARARTGYEHVWDELDCRKVPFTYHWGQVMRYESSPAAGLQRLKALFGDRVDRWLNARRRFLPDDKARALFSNKMLEQWGLAR